MVIADSGPGAEMHHLERAALPFGGEVLEQFRFAPVVWPGAVPDEMAAVGGAYARQRHLRLAEPRREAPIKCLPEQIADGAVAPRAAGEVLCEADPPVFEIHDHPDKAQTLEVRDAFDERAPTPGIEGKDPGRPVLAVSQRHFVEAVEIDHDVELPAESQEVGKGHELLRLLVAA